MEITHNNAIGKLNEFCQQNKYCEPKYVLVDKSGVIHSPTFKIQCTITIGSNDHSFEGTGKSKQSAKEQSACEAITFLKTKMETEKTKETIRIAQIGIGGETLLDLWYGGIDKIPIMLKHTLNNEITTKTYYLTEQSGETSHIECTKF